MWFSAATVAWIGVGLFQGLRHLKQNVRALAGRSARRPPELGAAVLLLVLYSMIGPLAFLED